MWTLPNLPSIHDVTPLELGGWVARRGFGYQDHVAVLICAEMLDGSDVSEVWCELLDDLTLLLTDGADTVVEHVQVKDHRNVLWGLTQVTARTRGRPGTSIVERSLAHDRCRERCWFRVISSADVTAELRNLASPRGDTGRALQRPAMQTLLNAMQARLPSATSPNGRGVDYWVEAIRWDVWGPESAVASRGLLLVGRVAHDIFELAAPDHHQALYDHILALVNSAAKADPRVAAEQKKIRRDHLLRIIRTRVQELKNPAPATGGTRLRHELTALGLDPTLIEAILIEHKRFTYNERQRKYLTLDEAGAVQDQVEALLRGLSLARLAEETQLSDLEFHNLCAREVVRLRAVGAPMPPEDYLRGMMYELVNRGLHTFQAHQRRQEDLG